MYTCSPPSSPRPALPPAAGTGRSSMTVAASRGATGSTSPERTSRARAARWPGSLIVTRPGLTRDRSRSSAACRPATPTARWCTRTRRSGPLARTPPPGRPPAAAPAPALPASPRRSHSLFGPLHVGNELLLAGPRHHGHELPAVVAPVVENLLGRVHQQGHGRVLPLRHGATLATR